jgi:hypothetical protein
VHRRNIRRFLILVSRKDVVAKHSKEARQSGKSVPNEAYTAYFVDVTQQVMLEDQAQHKKGPGC